MTHGEDLGAHIMLLWFLLETRQDLLGLLATIQTGQRADDLRVI